MATIVLALHTHLPQVLRHYSVFDQGAHYFDAFRSREATRRLAHRCILPANRILLGLIRRSDGRFRFSFSLSGVAVDLFERYAPEALISFQALTDTGCAEPLCMPYDNSLALLYSRGGFREQVRMHRERMAGLFHREPTVFRNSEMIYGEDMLTAVREMGIQGAVADGIYDSLGGRSCNRVWWGGDEAMPLPLLLRNEQLTRDVSERFADRNWDQWPLTAPRFAERLAQFRDPDDVLTLVWDYCTFGLAIPADAGILDFLRYLPEKTLEHEHLRFATASESLNLPARGGRYAPGRVVSTTERQGNLSPWLGNPMQSHAAHRLFALEPAVHASRDEAVQTDWMRLQACEYLEAMNMAPGSASGALWSVAAASPYDAFINYMNICDNLCERCGVAVPA